MKHFLRKHNYTLLQVGLLLELHASCAQIYGYERIDKSNIDAVTMSLIPPSFPRETKECRTTNVNASHVTKRR